MLKHTSTHSLTLEYTFTQFEYTPACRLPEATHCAMSLVWVALSVEIRGKEVDITEVSVGLGEPLGVQVTTQTFRARGQEAGAVEHVNESLSGWAGYPVTPDRYLLKERTAGWTKTPHFQLVELPICVTQV